MTRRRGCGPGEDYADSFAEEQARHTRGSHVAYSAYSRRADFLRPPTANFILCLYSPGVVAHDGGKQHTSFSEASLWRDESQ